MILGDSGCHSSRLFIARSDRDSEKDENDQADLNNDAGRRQNSPRIFLASERKMITHAFIERADFVNSLVITKGDT